MPRKPSIVAASFVTLAFLFFCAIPSSAQGGVRKHPPAAQDVDENNLGLRDGALVTSGASGQHMDRCVAGAPQPVFTAPSGEDTECVAISSNGDVLTAEMYSGKIYRIRPDGTATVIATLFPPGAYPNLLCVGVLLGRKGDLYVLANTWDPVTHGVWRVHSNGTFELYAAIPPAGSFLNGMTFDDRGNLFVTDSTLGAIWKVSRNREVQSWISSDVLIWWGDPTGPFGANGIAYRDGMFYVAVTDAGYGLLPDERGSNYPVVTVPVLHDGSAGQPQVLLSDNLVLASDGLGLDRSGHLYVVDFGGLAWGPGFPNAGPAKLVRVRLDGTDEDVVASAGLQNSASVLIVGQTAYVTNLYVTDVPNIVKIDLCANHHHHRWNSDSGDEGH